MKATAIFVSLMAICLLVIPLTAAKPGGQAAAVNIESPIHNPVQAQSAQTREPVQTRESVDESAWDEYLPEESAREPETEDAYGEAAAESGFDADSQYFRILDLSTGEVNEVSVRDFVRGAVAAEMPALFHTEALKAQAVAAHTFALHNRILRRESPDSSLKGADFEADPSNMKVYITEETAREFYGDNADLYWLKVCNAADSVLDLALEYDGEPIVAAYHAISSGATEDAANLWTGNAPYLASVKSDGDLLAPGYETYATFTAAEVKEKLAGISSGIELGDDPADWFGEPVRADSGYVLEIAAGGETFAGKDMRQAFDLRSHDFTVNYRNGEFTFTVYGYGHGLGLSQYGADFLARQGLSFDEILETYYTGVRLVTLGNG